MKEEQIKVGTIGVDAGLCWIGDPCYILGDNPNRKFSWSEFCDELWSDETNPTMKSFPYAKGHEGLGVCVSTGFGDGCYDVIATVIDDPQWGRRVKKVEVIFIED